MLHNRFLKNYFNSYRDEEINGDKEINRIQKKRVIKGAPHSTIRNTVLNPLYLKRNLAKLSSLTKLSKDNC